MRSPSRMRPSLAAMLLGSIWNAQRTPQHKHRHFPKAIFNIPPHPPLPLCAAQVYTQDLASCTGRNGLICSMPFPGPLRTLPGSAVTKDWVQSCRAELLKRQRGLSLDTESSEAGQWHGVGEGPPAGVLSGRPTLVGLHQPLVVKFLEESFKSEMYNWGEWDWGWQGCPTHADVTCEAW